MRGCMGTISSAPLNFMKLSEPYEEQVHPVNPGADEVSAGIPRDAVARNIELSCGQGNWGDASKAARKVKALIQAKPFGPARQSSTLCSANRSLDSLTASRMSFVVALVLMPGTSNGESVLFLKTIEKVSPPLLLITTSSVRAILSTSERRCLASE